MSDADRELDHAVRLAAFEFLDRYGRFRGETFDRATLEAGFEFRGERVRLVGPQGIFKPKILPLGVPLSILTVAPKRGQKRPYDDGFQADGTVIYRYRGTDPQHHENVGLRRAMAERLPLIYFHGTVPGKYVAAWPVYIIGDDPTTLSFRVEVDAEARSRGLAENVEEGDLRRRYQFVSTRQRLHQEAFRHRVLRAYREQCAVCRLRHSELLDAAHILPDLHPEGEPRVTNGLSLCKLHHSAYDQNLFGIRPDRVVEVADSVLEEEDGPMLVVGLQQIHESRIVVPRSRGEWPDVGALEERYEAFRVGL